MRFWMDSKTKTMQIDNATITPINSIAALPSNVRYVQWNGMAGEIEYKDSLGVRWAFNDTSVYQPQINDWMTAAQSKTPAIVLWQAQKIKKDMVDDLFNVKALGVGLMKPTDLLAAINDVIASFNTGIADMNNQSGESWDFVNQDYVDLINIHREDTATPMAHQAIGAPVLAAMSPVSATGGDTVALNNIRMAKLNAIDALTTVAQVIAYDVTAGW